MLLAEFIDRVVREDVFDVVVKKPTNADRIRTMSDEELAAEFVFFCPTNSAFRGEPDYEKPHYTGFDGKYYSTSDEVVHANTKWLQQPAMERTLSKKLAETEK